MYTRRTFLKVLGLGATAFALGVKAAANHAIARPNVVFFLSDDMGWGDSRINNPDSKISMPNLEKLASEGMNFTHAYSPAALCAPTRYSAMTGNYPWRGNKEFGTWQFYQPPQILDGQMTVGNILKDSGYETAIFGKLHLGGNFFKVDSDEITRKVSEVDFSRRFRMGPLDYGFDYSYLALSGIQNQPYAFLENDLLVGNAEDMITWVADTYGDSQIPKTGVGMPYWDSSQVGPILAQKAVDFIDQHYQKNRTDGTDTPFLVYYCSQAAHSPYTPPETFHERPVRDQTAMTPHTDMIYENNVALGVLMEALETRGLLHNTLIVFTSDNGGIPDETIYGHDAVGGLRGRKGEIWEGGVRVPLVTKWGDGTRTGSVIRPGSTSNQVIGVNDLMATLAALTGQTLLEGQGADSFNFMDVLLGLKSDDEPIRDHIILQSGGRDGKRHAIREGDWKLITDTTGTIVQELYNLSNDPTETTNLIDDPEHLERIQQMFDRYTQLRDSTRTAPVLAWATSAFHWHMYE